MAKRKARLLTEEERVALDWLGGWLRKLQCEAFGGYPGNIYRLGEVIFSVDPGNESTKYSDLSAWGLKDLVKIHQRWGSLGAEDEDENDDWSDIYDALEEAEIAFDSVDYERGQVGSETMNKEER